MKIKEIHIKHYKSLKDVVIYPNDIMGFVGGNNSGKSSVLNALELFFDGSIKLLHKECFYQNDSSTPIEISIVFRDLNEIEKENFKPWMHKDDLMVIKKFISTDEDSYSINICAEIEIPDLEFLQEKCITGAKISEWWKNRADLLDIGSPSLLSMLGSSKPAVSEWKEVVSDFITNQKESLTWKKEILDNPTGYSGVLKGYLPELIYIPAVRDILDETKVAKTNPFGKLVNSIVEQVSEEKLSAISQQLESIQTQLNRSGGENRLEEVQVVETKLNNLMKELMECDVEIEMSIPKVKEVFSGAKIYAHDGVRTSIETKGHGLQRSMIFTILRAYAEISNAESENNVIKTTIFMFEEPELYLHPQMQRNLAETLRTISKGADQIFFTTHSSLFIDIGNFDDVCIMRREKVENKWTSYPTQLSMQALLDDLKIRKGVDGTELGMRELYRKAFNLLVNEGFFAKKVVIVEGLSEQYILPIYAKVLGSNLDMENVSVVSAGGKGPIDRLVRVFDGFNIPVYIWFDGDKDNTKSSIKRKTLELLEMFGDPVDNIEEVTTKVADNFAVLENKLENLLVEEIENYETLANDASEQIMPIGKPLRHRYMALEIAKEVKEGTKTAEDVVPPTIQSIVKKISELESCGNFLKSYEEVPESQ